MTSVAVDASSRGCRGRQVCLEAMVALDIDHDDVLQSRVLRYLSFIDELQVRREYRENISFAVHSLRNALGTLAPLFRRGLPNRSVVNTASVQYCCMYFGRSRRTVLRRPLSHNRSQFLVQERSTRRHIHLGLHVYSYT